ncbi:hypothetical protein ACG74X_16455 [Marivita sp. S0852]|uniref:hypothetical protein n=1 Tax=Marivita sp. S0852 TaxID=3373893 RepID=UPI0039827BE1
MSIPISGTGPVVTTPQQPTVPKPEVDRVNAALRALVTPTGFSGGGSAARAGLAAPRESGDLEAMVAEISLALGKTVKTTEAEGAIAGSESNRTGLLALLMQNAALAGLTDKVDAEQATIGDENKIISDAANRRDDAQGKIDSAEGKIGRLTDAIAERDDKIEAERAKDSPDTGKIVGWQAANASDRAEIDRQTAVIDTQGGKVDAEKATISAAEGRKENAERRVEDLNKRIEAGLAGTLIAAAFAASQTSREQRDLVDGASGGEVDLEQVFNLLAARREGADEALLDLESELSEALAEAGAAPGTAARVAGIGAGMAAGVGSTMAALHWLVGDDRLFSAIAGPPAAAGERMRMAL